MRVLLTRPELQARATGEKLSALGHDPVIWPLFARSHDPEAAIAGLRRPHSAIALTSAEAVRCLARLGGMLEPHFDEPVFAVGKTTAEAAEALGFKQVLRGTGNGQDLGALIAGHFAASGTMPAPVLYLTGHRRAGGLEKALEEHRLACLPVAIYDMQPIVHSLEEQQKMLVNRPVDAVFFYSRENARAFFGLEVFNLSQESLKKTLFFCLSRNIAEAVPEELKNSAVVSLNPDEDELIDLL